MLVKQKALPKTKLTRLVVNYHVGADALATNVSHIDLWSHKEGIDGELDFGSCFISLASFLKNTYLLE